LVAFFNLGQKLSLAYTHEVIKEASILCLKTFSESLRTFFELLTSYLEGLRDLGPRVSPPKTSYGGKMGMDYS